MSAYILILPFLFFLINCQLTIQDKEALGKYIFEGQSKNTGLFFENTYPFKHTKEAISALQILGLEVKHKIEICKKISQIKEIDANIIAIDQLLDCKNGFKNYKPDLTKARLIDLYNEGKSIDILNINQWQELYKKLKNFLVQENGKFSLSKIKENKKKSIIATAIGAEILSLIANKSPNLKNEILPLLKKSIDSLMNSYSELNNDMIVFLEKNVACYKLNYHVIKALKDAKKTGVEINLLNNNLYKLLNYFNTFKYEMISNIDNTYYLLNIYKLLEKIPLIQVNK